MHSPQYIHFLKKPIATTTCVSNPTNHYCFLEKCVSWAICSKDHIETMSKQRKKIDWPIRFQIITDNERNGDHQILLVWLMINSLVYLLTEPEYNRFALK